MQSRESQSIKPIQLISFDDNKKMVLQNSAIKILQSLAAQQLHIITVAGKYRTGKSYILNRVLLNQNSGFEVGPTINACTKGLWMWPKIVQIKFQNIVKKCIIIDTQGLGSLQEGENTDIKIFLMAVLLSSYLIYNSVGSIDQKAIESLSLIINLAELLHKNQNQYDSQQLINSFPSFMWLVRDFSLRLQNLNGQPISSSQYLQNSLKYLSGNLQAVERKNYIRKKLKTFFQDRNCFTLVRPTQNEKDLQNLSTLSQKKLRPQFIKSINQLKQIVSSRVGPKKLRGKIVTPQSFVQLCKHFVDSINSGKLPSINSHWQNLCVKQSSRIINYFSQYHLQSLKNYLNLPQGNKEKADEIERIHNSICKQAYGQIQKTFLGKLQKQLCKQKIQKNLDKNYEMATHQLKQQKFSVVKEIVKKIFTQIIQQYHNNQLESFEEVFARFQQIKQKYRHEIRIYQSFYQNSKQVFKQFLQSLKEHWSHQQCLLLQKNTYLQNMIASKTSEQNKKIQDLCQSLRQSQLMGYKLTLQNDQLKQTNQRMNTKLQQANMYNFSLQEQIQQLKNERYEVNALQAKQSQSRAEMQAINYSKQINRYEIELINLNELYKDLSIKQRKTQRQMQIFKNKCSEYLKQNINLNQKNDQLNKKVIELEQDKRKNRVEKVNQKQKNCSDKYQVNQVLQQLSKQISQLQIKLKMKQQQVKCLSSILNNQKIAHQTLMKSPHNINYSILKKNLQSQQTCNRELNQKISQFQIYSAFYLFKCPCCLSQLSYSQLKAHTSICIFSKKLNFDVSYQYNEKGELQFLIDVCIQDQTWTTKKTVSNIKHLLNKLHFIEKTTLFEEQTSTFKNIQQEIRVNQQRRTFLDQILFNVRANVWNSLFLIQYFAIDIHLLTCKLDKSKCNLSKSKNLGISLENIQQNIDPLICNLNKTTKFHKKTFNFGNI